MRWIATLILIATTAVAEPVPVVPGADGVIVIQPAVKDTYSLSFVGRTISLANKGTATAALRGIPKQADASPTAIITNHSADGTSAVSITINPDYGCGTAGCRAGNVYEIILQPTDADGNTPIGNLLVIVQKKVLSAP
jgi:hypothetical protein